MVEFKFNHESDKIPVAMGFTEEFDDLCRERVMFSAISTHFITEEFFDNEEDTPKNLNTITGILEKTLNTCKSETEQMYTLLIFRPTFDMATEAVAKYKILQEEDDKTKSKLKILMELVELKALMDKDSDRKDLITPKDLFRKIDLIKNNLYSFENYYKELKDNVE